MGAGASPQAAVEAATVSDLGLCINKLDPASKDKLVSAILGDEVSKRMEHVFKRVDLARSGFLDKSELVKFCREGDQNENAAQVLLESCDANKDGKVAMDEWKAMFVKEATRSNKEMLELLAWFEDLAVGLQNKRVENLFARVDFDQSGSLDKSELVKFCKEGGQNDAAAQVLLESCDTDKDNKVTVEEWKAMFAKESARSDRDMLELLAWFEDLAVGLQEKRVQNLFQRVDFDRSGFLDKSELVKFCKEGGQNEAAAQVLLESCDNDKDNKVNLLEWKGMFAKESARSDRQMLELLGWFEDLAAGLEKKRVENLFARVDFDRSGSLDKSELVKFCQEGGQNEAAAQVLLESCDNNKDDKVSIEEWKAMFAKESARSDREMLELLTWFEELAGCLQNKRVEDLFARVDLDSSGLLDKTELVKLCKEGDQNEAAAQVLLESCDTDKDGKVSVTEWKGMFAKESARSDREMIELLVWFEELAKAMEKTKA